MTLKIERSYWIEPGTGLFFDQHFSLKIPAKSTVYICKMIFKLSLKETR